VCGSPPPLALLSPLFLARCPLPPIMRLLLLPLLLPLLLVTGMDAPPSSLFCCATRPLPAACPVCASVRLSVCLAPDECTPRSESKCRGVTQNPCLPCSPPPPFPPSLSATPSTRLASAAARPATGPPGPAGLEFGTR
jgi:hypothetical protein